MLLQMFLCTTTDIKRNDTARTQTVGSSFMYSVNVFHVHIVHGLKAEINYC